MAEYDLVNTEKLMLVFRNKSLISILLWTNEILSKINQKSIQNIEQLLIFILENLDRTNGSIMSQTAKNYRLWEGIFMCFNYA